MPLTATQHDVAKLVTELDFARKVDRSLGLIREAWEEYGDRPLVDATPGDPVELSGIRS